MADKNPDSRNSISKIEAQVNNAKNIMGKLCSYKSYGEIPREHLEVYNPGQYAQSRINRKKSRLGRAIQTLLWPLNYLGYFSYVVDTLMNKPDDDRLKAG